MGCVKSHGHLTIQNCSNCNSCMSMRGTLITQLQAVLPVFNRFEKFLLLNSFIDEYDDWSLPLQASTVNINQGRFENRRFGDFSRFRFGSTFRIAGKTFLMSSRRLTIFNLIIDGACKVLWPKTEDRMALTKGCLATAITRWQKSLHSWRFV